jgi:GNAT superfamily N-acetyltransferase
MTSIRPGPAAPARGGPRGNVITADLVDTDVLSQVVADAFFDLPPSRWLVPDPAARQAIFPGYFRLYVEHAMASGVVHTTPDRSAAALWLPIGDNPADLPPGNDARLAAATGRWIDRFLAFGAALDRHHPAGTPHHHLAILAVRPDRQGQGTGTMLVRAYHQLLDHDIGAPAYLEAANQRTQRMYLRHGYILRPNAPIRLPDSGPLMWPMWREPQRKPDASHAVTVGGCEAGTAQG